MAFLDDDESNLEFDDFPDRRNPEDGDDEGRDRGVPGEDMFGAEELFSDEESFPDQSDYATGEERTDEGGGFDEGGSFGDDLDEGDVDEEFPMEDLDDGGPPGRPPRTPRQQIFMRRLVAVGAGALVLILIVVAFRGCLDARKERAIKNFVSDVGSLMTESEQIGNDFFSLLGDSGGRTALEYEAEIKSFRGASETLYDRATKLDAPDEMSSAKEAFVTTLELRRNGLTAIGNSIGPALGRENATDAQKRISDQMQLLFASDAVCTGIALPETVEVVNREGVSGEQTSIPCDFFPDPPVEWLDLTAVTEALGQVSGEETVTSGVHGMEIVMSSIGDVQLLPDTEVTVSSADPTLTVEVLNGGDSEETDVNVTITVGATDLSQSIPRIGPGDTIPLEIPITPVPAPGSGETIEVSIDPVPGEEIVDNNTSTYPVIFE